jgi:hypothetical protein
MVVCAVERIFVSIEVLSNTYARPSTDRDDDDDD